MIATRTDQIRERQENNSVKMADVALKDDLALVHFLVLPLYKQSACAKICAPVRAVRANLFHSNHLFGCLFCLLEEEIFFRSSRFIICKLQTLNMKKPNLLKKPATTVVILSLQQACLSRQRAQAHVLTSCNLNCLWRLIFLISCS